MDLPIRGVDPKLAISEGARQKRRARNAEPFDPDAPESEPEAPAGAPAAAEDLRIAPKLPDENGGQIDVRA